jgi:hypothetical protein
LVLKDRNQQYKDKYGTEDASLHPYYDQLPTGTIVVNQNLGYFATPGKEDFAKYAAGRVTKSEFDESCQLDLQMSLYIPCGKRSPKVEFFDIADFGNALADPLPSTEYRAEAIQDWTDGPDAGDCAFDETLKLYVNPNGSGGGDFGMIKARAGTTPPYRYAAWGAVMDINGVWSAVSSKLYEPVYNKEEQGTGGQYVNPLNVGDVISVKRAPGGADAYVGERSHYRGTF